MPVASNLTPTGVPGVVPGPPPLAAQSRFISTQASVLLDLVRALAAFLVLFSHWRNIFFLDFPDLQAHRLLFALPYLLSSAGHQSVVIFFVLSGYLISGSVFRLFDRNAWLWRTYLLHRLVRLWIVLLPGLLLAALWDFIGLHLQRPGAILLYTGLSGDHLSLDIRPSFHLSAWLGNLFFLQTIRVPIFGSSSPLWSLANEFWYYLLFPLALLVLRKTTPPLQRILYAALFALLALFVKSGIMLLFPVWLLGTALALLPPPRLPCSTRIIASIVYLPLLFFFAKNHRLSALASDWIFALLTFVFLWVLLSAQAPSKERSPATRLTRLCARFSYTLYVVHLPVLILSAALLLTPARWVPDPLHLTLALVLLVLTLLYALALASLTEFRTDRLRKAIEQKIPWLVTLNRPEPDPPKT